MDKVLDKALEVIKAKIGEEQKPRRRELENDVHLPVDRRAGSGCRSDGKLD